MPCYDAVRRRRLPESRGAPHHPPGCAPAADRCIHMGKEVWIGILITAAIVAGFAYWQYGASWRNAQTATAPAPAAAPVAPAPPPIQYPAPAAPPAAALPALAD